MKDFLDKEIREEYVKKYGEERVEQAIQNVIRLNKELEKRRAMSRTELISYYRQIGIMPNEDK